MPSSKLVTGNTETRKAQFLFFRTLFLLRETDLYSDKLQQSMASAMVSV